MAAQEHEVWKSKVLRRVEPQIFEMLRAVRARGLKVGIISNALPEEVLAWQFCPLQDHVDPVVFSCRVGVMKPDSEIFELACSRMCVQPSEAYFVGDGGYDELQGAASVGMKTIQAAWYQDRDVEWSCTSPLVRGKFDKGPARTAGLDKENPLMVPSFKFLLIVALFLNLTTPVFSFQPSGRVLSLDGIDDYAVLPFAEHRYLFPKDTREFTV